MSGIRRLWEVIHDEYRWLRWWLTGYDWAEAYERKVREQAGREGDQ